MLTSQSFSVNKLSQKGSVHIFLIIILLLGIISGVYLVQKTQIFKPKASEGTQQDIQTLTNSLIEAKDNYNNELSTLSFDSKLQKLQEMIDLAKIRKDGLIKELKRNPKLFLEHTTLVNQRSTFPQEIQESLEKEEIIEGELLISHIDDFQEKKSQYIFGLQREKTIYNVYFAENNFSDSMQNIKASIKGTSIENNIVTTGDKENFRILSTEPIQFNEGATYNIAVLKIKGAVDMLPSEENLRKMFTEDLDSVKNYYQKTAYNRANFNFDILGTYNISTEGFECNYEGLRKMDQNIESAFTANGIDINRYKIVQVFVPLTQTPFSCVFQEIGGIVDKYGKVNYSYIFGTLKIQSLGLVDVKTVSMHELGHNLGFGHSSTVLCLRRDHNTNTLVRDRLKCSDVDYGDETNHMGQIGYFGEMDPSGKYKNKWLLDSEVQTVTENVTAKIAPYGGSFSAQAKKVIIVGKPFISKYSDTLDFYKLTYRARKGLDMNLPGSYTQGVSIFAEGGKDYITLDGEIIPGGPSGRLGTIDSLEKGVLRDGETFYDKVNGIRMTQLSHDENSVTVEIKYGE